MIFTLDDGTELPAMLYFHVPGLVIEWDFAGRDCSISIGTVRSNVLAVTTWIKANYLAPKILDAASVIRAHGGEDLDVQTASVEEIVTYALYSLVKRGASMFSVGEGGVIHANVDPEYAAAAVKHVFGIEDIDLSGLPVGEGYYSKWIDIPFFKEYQGSVTVGDVTVSYDADAGVWTAAADGMTLTADSAFCVTHIAFGETAVKGDVNGDGDADLKDVLMLRRIIAGIETGGDFADVNGDGDVNLKDVLMLRRIIAGVE